MGYSTGMEDFSPTSRYFISQRLKLHYVDWGNASAPSLLLLHGGRDHCRSWDWVARQLCADWHVLALDLRGHGDSAWSPDGDYSLTAHVYDLTQWIHQLQMSPVTIVAHSLGGNIALRYTGLYPDQVQRLVSIEGLGPSPTILAERNGQKLPDRWHKWIDERRALSGRMPRRYASFEDALARMRSENKFLSEAQALHLTSYATGRNEDGSWSWKFDNYMHSFPPVDLSVEQVQSLWAAITCPTLLCYGDKSWASNPGKDGRASHFRNARVASFPNAGHWVHHDQLAAFMLELRTFLAEPMPV